MDTTPTPALAQLVNLAEELPYQAEKFNHRQVLDQNGRKVLLFAFAAGQELKTHTTPHPAVLILLEGSCQFHLNGTSQVLTAGAVIIIPAEVPHSLTAIQDFKMVLVK